MTSRPQPEVPITRAVLPSTESGRARGDELVGLRERINGDHPFLRVSADKGNVNLLAMCGEQPVNSEFPQQNQHGNQDDDGHANTKRSFHLSSHPHTHLCSQSGQSSCPVFTVGSHIMHGEAILRRTTKRPQ